MFSGEDLYYAIISGAVEVVKNKASLNKINVFPVADGDTGSNVSATMNSVIINLKYSQNIFVVFESLANAAMLGSRGNSGIIFAQFFYGIYSECKNYSEFTIDDLVTSLKISSNRLYDVVQNPKEGTILTIIKETISLVEQNFKKIKSEKEFVNNIITGCKKVLDSTPDLLPILKANKVLDSGAKAFFHFVDGISKYILTKEKPTIINSYDLNFDENHVLLTKNKIKFRYCTEFIFTESNINFNDLKNLLSNFGDSLVIAGDKNFFRIHIHTNIPEKVFFKLQSFGEISQVKIDDMKIMASITHNRKSSVGILTDSIADVSKEFLLKNQVLVMPMQIEFNNVVHLDKYSISCKKFYEQNKNLDVHPATSTPTLQSIKNNFSFMAQNYKDIIVISVSDKLSASYSALCQVAEEYRKNGINITVINSLQNSGAQGLLVKKAADMAMSGSTFEEIVNEIENTKRNTKILVALNTVKYLKRSGRVNVKAVKFLELFKLKPIMTLDKNGFGKAYGASFTQSASFKKIINKIKKDLKKFDIEEFNIVHGDNFEVAKKFSSELEKVIQKKAFYIEEISSIVGAISGSGAVAVSYTLKEKSK